MSGRLLSAGIAILMLAPASAAAPTQSTEGTRRIATAFLHRLFAANDVAGAYRSYAAPDFVQHNPNMADGIAGHAAYFAARARDGKSGNPKDWANVTDMVLVDGDLFAVLHHRFTDPADSGQMFADIWRVANGRIVEHWDVIQPIPAHMPQPNGMGCGPGQDYVGARAMGARLDDPTCGRPDRGTTRAKSLAVVRAYTGQLGTGDVRGAILRWFAPNYRQHSPTIGDGVQGAIDYLDREFGDRAAAKPRLGPARIIAEGDYVLSHRRVTPPDGPPRINVDVFRITDGKISEHWDIKQQVPATTASGHGMD